MILRAGVIAAGLGERLQGAYPGLPKAMVRVAGRPLCHWTADALCAAGATSILLAHNSTGRAIRDSVSSAFAGVRWSFIEADTASSWETFRLVCAALAGEAEGFVVSTVDALIPPSEARRFSAAIARSKADAALALTEFVDDEKPLWVDVDSAGRVIAMGEDATQRRFVTCGLYYMTRETANDLPAPDSYSSLRAYLTVLAKQAHVLGVPLAKTVDIDRPADILAAEKFLKKLEKEEAAAP